VPKSAATVRVGTSGWEYNHWRGRFYPADLPKSRWLEHYAAELDTVELNNSFYRLPEADAFAAWRRRVPRDFAMAVKASRYLTHLKRLREPDEPLERFWSRATKLGDRLGPVLYQLPPRWGRNLERLSSFCAAAPPRRPQAVEFRDPSWYDDETDAVLADAGFALCLHDMRGSERVDRPIGPFVYVRFHGSGARYGGAYPAQRLVAWADRLAGWARDGLPGWVYFNNDLQGHAVRDALRLREYLARRGVG
jgi:uncharacterized protein YecE (DUF72 family)